jgi:hypothetical protein
MGAISTLTNKEIAFQFPPTSTTKITFSLLLRILFIIDIPPHKKVVQPPFVYQSKTIRGTKYYNRYQYSKTYCS